VLGVGNRERGDDAAGPAIAERLAERGVAAIDAGNAPENYLGRLARLEPDEVLVIDAVDIGAEPGAVKLLAPEELGGGALSTHAAGLGPLAEYVRGACGASCHVLAVQPLALAGGLSPAVRDAVERIAASPIWPELTCGAGPPG
jgi:hydrogenase 3 maturation protease